MQETAIRPVRFAEYVTVPKSKDARLHRAIYGRIVRVLAGRSQAWLCRESGIAETTLSYQLREQKFTVEVLVAVADALEVDVGWLIRGDERAISPEAAARAFEQIRRIVERT